MSWDGIGAELGTVEGAVKQRVLEGARRNILVAPDEKQAMYIYDCRA